jgi:glyoxylase I family protein
LSFQIVFNMIPDSLKQNLYIDHIVLTVASIPETKAFYSKIFYDPKFENEDSIMFQIGKTRLFFVEQKENPAIKKKFDPNIIGLEHLAFGVRTLGELEEIEKNLTEKSINNSGIHIDSHSNKEKIWLNDPSGIRIEFFLRPA